MIDARPCSGMILALNSLGDWGSWVQIPPLRPTKSSTYDILEKPQNRRGPTVDPHSRVLAGSGMRQCRTRPATPAETFRAAVMTFGSTARRFLGPWHGPTILVILRISRPLARDESESSRMGGAGLARHDHARRGPARGREPAHRCGRGLGLQKPTAERMLKRQTTKIFPPAEQIVVEVEPGSRVTAQGEQRCLRAILHTVVRDMIGRLA